MFPNKYTESLRFKLLDSAVSSKKSEKFINQAEKKFAKEKKKSYCFWHEKGKHNMLKMA